MLRFDENRLKAELTSLSPIRRTAFAAACAERLMPAYEVFVEKTGRGDAAGLRSILTRVWAETENPSPAAVPELNALVEVGMALIPGEDDGPWVEEQASAEDAAAAVVFALRCRISDDAQEAVWAARRVYDTLDHAVMDLEAITPDSAAAEDRILRHPLVQAEFVRQRRDLDELTGASVTEEKSIIRGLRGRAVAEASRVFG